MASADGDEALANDLALLFAPPDLQLSVMVFIEALRCVAVENAEQSDGGTDRSASLSATRHGSSAMDDEEDKTTDSKASSGKRRASDAGDDDGALRRVAVHC